MALATGAHVIPNDTAWFVAPFKGDSGVGDKGMITIVVKLFFIDHALVPPEFVALTRQ